MPRYETAAFVQLPEICCLVQQEYGNLAVKYKYLTCDEYDKFLDLEYMESNIQSISLFKNTR